MMARMRAMNGRKALILMYHQVSQRRLDPWELAVYPHHFHEHLAYLRRHFDVVPVDQLARSVMHRQVKPAIAITFDDGFRDNYSHAAPMLDWYNLPATFYFSTESLSGGHRYWWDILQAVILEQEVLPARLDMQIGDCHVRFAFNRDRCLTRRALCDIRAWSYPLPVPNERVFLFLQLWRLLQPLCYEKQEQALAAICAWAGHRDSKAGAAEVMTVRELQMLAQNHLFSVGAHTVHHAMLAACPPAQQAFEVFASKRTLEQWTGKAVGGFAYPYGNYTNVTCELIAAAGYQYAVSTDARAVTERDHRFALPRMQVRNWCVHEFAARIREALAEN